MTAFRASYALRVCSICKKELPGEAFFRSEKHRCKSCHAARMKEIRQTNPAVRANDRARAKRPERKEFMIETAKRWRAENPLGYKAHYTVNNAVRSGRLKKLPCAECGTLEHVHAHHHDYTKPLDVTWLCAQCHKQLHTARAEA